MLRNHRAGTFWLGLALVLALPPGLADEYPCRIVSSGAETDTVTGSVQNVGQVLIGPTASATQRAHVGGLACLPTLSADACVGDADNDGDTDLNDLLLVLGDFGNPGPGAVGDVDGDNDTDLDDLLLLLANFGCA